jgi:outer membrane protein insertion porin family
LNFLYKKYIIIIFLLSTAVSAKVVIKNISFKGNNYFGTDVLEETIQSQKKKAFDARLINVDKILLKNLYISAGFLKVLIKDSIIVIYKKRDREVSLVYKINEGQRFYFDGLNINGNKIFSEAFVRGRFSGVKKGEPYNQQFVNDALQELEKRYYNTGKPYIQLTTSTEIRDSLITINLNIKEYMTVYIKNIIYIGLNKVQEFIVRRELEFKKNERYERNKIEISQKNIYRTGLFDYVRIELEPIENAADSVNIQVKLKEKNNNWFGVHLGFAYEEDIYYGNKLNVTLQGGNRNLFGTARSLSLHLTEGFQFDFDDNKFVNAENEIFLRFVEPWIFATRTPGVFQINYRLLRPINSAPYNLLTTSFLVDHEHSDWLKSSMIFSLKHINNLSQSEEIIENPEGLSSDQSMIYSFTFTLKRNRLDNFFNPHDGSRTMATVGLSDNVYYDAENRKKHSVYMTLSGSWARYQPWRPKIFNLPRFNFVLASRVRIGNIFVINKNDYVPQNDLFFAGGASTVRGYREQLLGPASVLNDKGEIIEGAGGKLIYLANIEARIPLFWLLMLEIFVDSGNVWRTTRDFNPAEIRYTTGAGIAFLTPIGPVRLDYGYKLNKPSTNPWPTAWHLGFYFAF